MDVDLQTALTGGSRRSSVVRFLNPLVPLMEVVLFWVVGGLLALGIMHIR